MGNEDMVAKQPDPSLSNNAQQQQPNATNAIQQEVGRTNGSSTASTEIDASADPSWQPVTAMDFAFVELQSTIQGATNVRGQPGVSQRLLQSHASALQEDSEMLATFNATDETSQARATQLILQARRLRRHIERDIIDLDIAETATNSQQQIMQLVPLDPDRTAGIKLAPLKMPTFAGNSSQFAIYRNFMEENILQSKLTDTAKWLRLEESLSGPPADMLSELPRTTETLDSAWKLLVAVYGNDERPVAELYERFQRLPRATNVTHSLRMTHSKLEGILLTLNHLGHPVDENTYIRWLYMNKFPTEVAYEVRKRRDTPLAELRTNIANLLETRESVDQQMGPAPERPAPAPAFQPPLSSTSIPAQRRAPFAAPAATEKNRPTSAASAPSGAWPFNCLFCAGSHWNDNCPVYATVEKRKERLSNKCLICLRRDHPGEPCAVKRRCFHCDTFGHNRALCPVKYKEPAVQASAVAEKDNSGYFLTFVAQAKSPALKSPLPVRVVIDTAGGTTVLRKEIADQLKITVDRSNSTNYTGLGETKLACSYKLNSPIQLLTLANEYINIQAEMVDHIIPEVPTANVQLFRDQFPQYNSTYIPPTGAGQPIDLLIGSDSLVDLLTAEKTTSIDKNTALWPTKFGSLIVGRQSGKNEQVCHHSLLFSSIKNPLNAMCNLDVVGLSDLHTSEIEEEEKAIQKFYDSVRFTNGRYSISWPWKFDPPLLESNFGLAMGRLRSLHKKLIHTPHLLQEYHSIIQKQIQDGIVEVVERPKDPVKLVHYLPHHPVLQPEKNTSLRPVYDGSSKTQKGMLSLNDNILKGKNWITNLVQTLLRFRSHKNAVIGDIAKAFHQIGINEEDRDVVRFLWLRDPMLPPEGDNLLVLRFTRVAFGVAASPFILSATISYHAKQRKPHKFTDILLRDMYADNLVSSLPADIDLNQFYNHVKEFFSSMSMNLTKWSSNEAEFLQSIPSEDQSEDIIQSVLGLRWNTKKDHLTIKQPNITFTKSPTRRTVAKEMAKYFDPLGWATPILLLAKAFFRRVWQQTEKWDEPLNPQQKEEWFTIVEQIKEISLIQLPRQFCSFTVQSNVQIHTFVDASAVAYAVVTYLRFQEGDQVHTSMVATRSRLTPLKGMTIPKLELVAIALGSKFTTFIKETLQLPESVKTFVWSDSLCALSWIRNDRILPAILEKHVLEAKKNNITHYRYVPTEMNFADVATRGQSYAALKQMKWWDGPQWLQKEDTWPADVQPAPPGKSTSLMFQKKLTYRAEIISEQTEGVATLQITQFSSITRLLVTTSYILHAAQKFRKVEFLKLQTHPDLHIAEMLWIKWDQNREYAIQGEPEAGREFLLRNISVFRDENGVIRCITRITNAAVELDTKSPILLVKNSKLTKLIVMHIHLLHHHAGTNHTLANVRQRYWLPHGRRQVYKIILNECYKCRRQLAITYPNPPPAPLPEFRVLRSQRPFQTVGVDAFGPIKVRHYEDESYTEQRRHVLIFTCGTIRAVHMEVIREISTQEVCDAFRKFFARRGVPERIVSDNAGAFHELDGKLQDLWRTFVADPTISKYFAERKIIWEFTVEYAAWMGGIYERLIQSVKIALERTYGSKMLSSKQFEIAVTEIEAVLNARPIGYIDQDPETHILTPNDFLRATFTAVPMNAQIEEHDDIINILWKSSQAYLDEFWKHWASQYLQILRERCDQLHQQRRSSKYQPAKGDIVIMYEPGKKRSAWQLAVVERFASGNDNIARSVQVRVADGTKKIRSVTHLAPLGLQMSLPKVHDNQLTKKRDALVVWPLEDGPEEGQKAAVTEMSTQQKAGESVPNSERTRIVPETKEGGVVQPAAPPRRFRLPGNVVVWTTKTSTGEQ